MLENTKEIVDLIIKKTTEMQKNHPNGIKLDLTPEDLGKLTHYNMGISVFGAAQFYTLARPFLSEEKAKEGLDLFFEDVKKETLNMINEREKYYKKST